MFRFSEDLQYIREDNGNDPLGVNWSSGLTFFYNFKTRRQGFTDSNKTCKIYNFENPTDSSVKEHN